MPKAARQSPLPLGAHAMDHGEVRFALFAPHKRHVHVVGDFNIWNRTADPLESAHDGMWTLRKSFEPGEHRYQFVVDGTLIADPYARAVRWEQEQPGPDAVPVSLVEVGQPAFNWQHDDRPRPALGDLILYELGVAGFSPEANFQGVTDRLDYLQDLGVNAVELMPVTAGVPGDAWGYRPTYLFAPAPWYGSGDDLRRLVDACHQRGMAVILDLVLAHTAQEHPFNRLYDYAHSPWFGQPLTDHHNIYALPTYDYRKPATQRYIRDVIHHWLREYHVDGFRYDYMVLIGREGDLGTPLLVDAARQVLPEAHLIAEFLPENPMQVNDTGLSAGWHIRISHALRALLLHRTQGRYHPSRFDQAMHALEPSRQGYNDARAMINYIESHDEPRLLYELIEAGHEPTAARRKAALALSVLMTMPGQPMLYQGQEWGEAEEQHVNTPNAVRWDLLETAGGRGLHEHVRRLCWLRHEHDALRSQQFALDEVHAHSKSVGYHRWNDAGDEVWVAANFCDRPQQVSMPLPAGTWRDVLRHHDVETDGEPIELTLQAHEAAVLVRGEAAGEAG